MPTAEGEIALRLRRSPLVLVVVGGPVASGKSTLAASLAARLDALHVGSDEVRDEMPSRPGLQAFSAKLEQEIYAELLRRVDRGLAAGRCVVADGCFALARERAETRAMAVKHGAPFLFVECRVEDDVLRQRLAARDARLDEPFWQAVADDVAARSQPVAELPRDEYAAIGTDGSNERALEEIAARLRARRAHLAMPEAVTFDCWNTLIYEADWPLAHELRVSRLRHAAEAAGQPISHAEAARVFDAAWTRHMELWVAGEATGAREVARWSLETLGLADSHDAFEHLVAAFEEASHSGRVVVLDGARETLRALERAGVPCALVCDTGLTPGRVVRQHLDRLGLLDSLAVQVFSDEVGVPKPDPRTFQHALDTLGVPPERALHVGDLRRTDVGGARSLLMRSVRIRARYDDTSPLPDADFVVDSHEALRALLGA